MSRGVSRRLAWQSADKKTKQNYLNAYYIIFLKKKKKKKKQHK